MDAGEWGVGWVGRWGWLGCAGFGRLAGRWAFDGGGRVGWRGLGGAECVGRGAEWGGVYAQGSL